MPVRMAVAVRVEYVQGVDGEADFAVVIDIGKHAPDALRVRRPSKAGGFISSMALKERSTPTADIGLKSDKVFWSNDAIIMIERRNPRFRIRNPWSHVA